MLEAAAEGWKRWIERHPVLLKVYAALSWLGLIAFIASLFIMEDSRTMFVQFLWSFYVLVQFWLLCRSKTVAWKTYMFFFLSAAWLVNPLTAFFVTGVHKIFGGDTMDAWSVAILTPIAEEVLKLLPLLLYLFVSRRASTLSLGDFALIGGAMGAGFQFMEETVRRLISGGILPYGYTLLGGQTIHWEWNDWFPGYFQESYWAAEMTSGHAVLTSVVAIGLGIGLRFRRVTKGLSLSVFGVLLFLAILDHGVYNGDYRVPDWIERFHHRLGSGHETENLLFLLIFATMAFDYWKLNAVRRRLPLLPGELWFDPFTELRRYVSALVARRERLFPLMQFHRERKQLGFTLLYGKPEAQEKLPDIRARVERYYRPLIGAAAAVIVILFAGWGWHFTVPIGADACFACMFDSLQSWWDGLSGTEKGLMVVGLLALSLLFVELWPAIGFVSTVTGVLGSGHSVAGFIRNPRFLLTPGAVLGMAMEMAINRLPFGRLFKRGMRKTDVDLPRSHKADGPEAPHSGNGKGGDGPGDTEKPDAPAPTKSRGEELREKYGTITPEELHMRINLRDAVLDYYADLIDSGMSKKQMGPALAGVLDTKTGKYYYGLNTRDGSLPDVLSPEMAKRLNQMPDEIRTGYVRTKGPGSHAEVFALNEAMLARPDADPSDFMVYVINSGGKEVTRGMPIPRCPHCEYLTDGTKYIPEVMSYGKRSPH